MLDGGLLDGRLLATSWSEDQAADPWLTLDSQPLVALPRSSRRQRLIACGESLQLRFGLMNEVVYIFGENAPLRDPTATQRELPGAGEIFML